MIAAAAVAAPSSGPLPDSDALTLFFMHLNAAGYGLAPQQLAASHQLLLTAHAEAWPPARLRRALRGLLAKSPVQQQDFDSRFASWLAPAVTAPAPPPPPRRTKYATWLIAAITSAICGALLTSLIYRPDCCAPPPPPVAVDHPVSGGKLTASSDDVRPSPGADFARLVALLPIAAFAVWLAMRWHRRTLWLARAPAVNPIVLPLPDGDAIADAVFPPQTIARIAWSLRQSRPRPGLTLDIARTAVATAGEGGVFTPRWRARAERPTYVFLIEEEGTHDHLARLFDRAVDGLLANDVHVERYYFHGDPRFLTADDPGRTPAWLPVVAERQARFPLVVIGTAQGFADIRSGTIDRRIGAVLDTFAQRVLLSTQPIAAWSGLEESLLERGFSVATATTAGLIDVADHLSAEPEQVGVLLGGWHSDDPFPVAAS